MPDPARLKAASPPIPALTGLRFFAAFFILVAHTFDWCAQFQNSEIRGYFGLLAMYGMPLFFVLSGFVIHYNYSSLFATQPLAKAISEFGAARFARLFPLYLCMLSVSVFADGFTTVVKHNHARLGDAALHFLTLTQSWFYKLWDGKLMTTELFPLAWSISTEAFFYLAYVGLVFILLRMSRASTTLGVGFAYAAGATALLWWPVYWINPEEPYYRWLFYYSPYVRIFEFGMGCLAAHLFQRIQARPVTRAERTLGACILGANLVFLVVAYLFRAGILVRPPINGIVNHLSSNFLLGPAFAAVIFCSCRYPTPFAAFLSRPLLVRLGETSYSIYLTHTWTLRLFNHAPPPFTTYWMAEAIGRVLVAMAFTLVVSYGTYSIIEVPARAWLRRVFLNPRNRTEGTP